MRFRKKLSSSASKRIFRRSSSPKKVNVNPRNMRGGIRL